MEGYVICNEMNSKRKYREKTKRKKFEHLERILVRYFLWKYYPVYLVLMFVFVQYFALYFSSCSNVSVALK